MSSVLHIACAADARFAADCAVMLTSLLDTHRPESLHVHLLHDDALPPDAVTALCEIVRAPGGRCEPVSVPTEMAAMTPSSSRFPSTAWHRIRLPELLPEVSRVLYVDADTLFAASVDELFATDLGGLPLGAVTTYLFPSMVARITSELAIRDPRDYFNSGVLLLDLDVWRAERLGDLVAGFVRTHTVIWPDQDSLSGVLHTRRLSLHPRWNAMPGLWELPESWMPYQPEEIERARRDPAIVHFLGPYKPWHHRSKSPYRNRWLEYLSQTVWHGRPIEGRTPYHRALRAMPPGAAARLEIAIDPWRARLYAAAVTRFPAIAQLRQSAR